MKDPVPKSLPSIIYKIKIQTFSLARFIVCSERFCLLLLARVVLTDIGKHVVCACIRHATNLIKKITCKLFVVGCISGKLNKISDGDSIETGWL